MEKKKVEEDQLISWINGGALVWDLQVPWGPKVVRVQNYPNPEAQLIDSPWVILSAYLCDSPPIALGNLAGAPNWARPSWEPLLPQISHSSTRFSLGCGASLLAGSLFFVSQGPDPAFGTK